MKLSIIIPVYRAEQFIERCARSLFEQTYVDMEYVFVDDCSPDDSIAVLRRVLAEYPARQEQVKIFRHDRNKGVIAARKTAFHLTTGEIVGNCDPDDWVAPGLYSEMVEQLERAGADAVMCPVVFEFGTHSVRRGRTDVFSVSGREVLRNMDEFPGFSSLVLRIVRRDLLDPDQYEWPDEVVIGEDLCLSVQLLMRCRLLTNVVGENRYHYRQNAQSLSHSRDMRRAFDNHRMIFEIVNRRYQDVSVNGVLRHLARTVLYVGVAHGLFSTTEFLKWRETYLELGGRWDWSDKSLWGRYMMKIAKHAFPLTRFLVPFVKRKVHDYL